jgi:DNA-binding MarR family transcriptional regulator
MNAQRTSEDVDDIGSMLDPIHCVSHNLQKTARAVGRVFAEEMRASGLTRNQYPVLGYLEAAGPCPVAYLASRLYMERTTLTRNLTPLQQAGFVERPLDPEDARVRLVAISPLGRSKLREANDAWRRAQTRVIQLFGVAEWRQLEGSLRTLRRLVQ